MEPGWITPNNGALVPLPLNHGNPRLPVLPHSGNLGAQQFPHFGVPPVNNANGTYGNPGGPVYLFLNGNGQIFMYQLGSIQGQWPDFSSEWIHYFRSIGLHDQAMLMEVQLQIRQNVARNATAAAGALPPNLAPMQMPFPNLPFPVPPNLAPPMQYPCFPPPQPQNLPPMMRQFQ